MTRWGDRRAHLRKRTISALYPLSRYWPLGAYEQPELWVSDALRICYVVNPKVACSSIQVALTEAATGTEVRGFRHNHPDVLAFRRTSFRDVPAGYFRFTFVRDPAARIVSFYKDKFLRPKQEGRGFDYAGYLGGVFAPDDSFEAVCAAIAAIPDRLSDRHFVSQGFWLNRICRVPLDYVGRLEALSSQWPVIAQRIGREIPLPRLNSSASIAFSPPIPHGIAVRYSSDFARFGYAPSKGG
jgi:hypothetical protein